MSSTKDQYTELLSAQGHSVDHCVVQEIQDETSQWEYTAQDKYLEDEKNCQETSEFHIVASAANKERVMLYSHVICGK